jgi:hypothetical protein
MGEIRLHVWLAGAAPTAQSAREAWVCVPWGRAADPADQLPSSPASSARSASTAVT